MEIVQSSASGRAEIGDKNSAHMVKHDQHLRVSSTTKHILGFASRDDGQTPGQALPDPCRIFWNLHYASAHLVFSHLRQIYRALLQADDQGRQGHNTFIAAAVETKRRNVALSHGFMEKPTDVIPMSALWLVPQYSVAGLAEAFSAIGQIEFLYSQFPENMRSIAGALFFLSMALGNYVSSLIVNIVHNTTGGPVTITGWRRI
jgi:hypothetical protein